MKCFPARLTTAPRPICLIFIFFLLMTVVRAADPKPKPAPNPPNPGPNPTTSTTTDGATTTTAGGPTTSTDSTSSTSTSSNTDSGTSTTSTDGNTSTTSTTDGLPTLPTLSSSTTATTTLGVTSGLPQLAVTSIPVVTVPPTANAPYMQTSNIPEGTVFIAVGGALGLIGLTVLAWRALVAWSVNRSVRRAAMLNSSETKRLIRTTGKQPSAAVYNHDQSATSLSLDKLSSNKRHTQRASKVPSTHSGLFFSPTAGSGMHTSGNRASSYLPAGYYAAGAAGQTGSNAGLSSPTQSGIPFSPSTLSVGGPTAQGYMRTRSGPSPPGSPLLPPSGHDASHHGHTPRQSYAAASTSSLNLSAPPQGRAPSAYLEDLFDGHAPPH